MTPDTRLLASAAGTLLGVLLLVAVGAWGGHAWRDRSARAELAECQRAHAAEREAAAQVAARAQADYRAREAQIHTQHQEAIDAATTQTAAAQADAARVRLALDRLRRHVAAPAAGGGAATAHPTLASPGAAAVTTPDLPPDLLGRLGAAAAELAAAADASRIAGLACQRAYQALTPQPPTE
jgi:Tfp pilus assembly protein PilE